MTWQESIPTKELPDMLAQFSMKKKDKKVQKDMKNVLAEVRRYGPLYPLTLRTCMLRTHPARTH